MAIYPDKKNGKLTGRFRVELQRGKDRYRKRWETYREAHEDEKRVQGLWASGLDAMAPVATPEAPKGTTIQQAINKLQGVLWHRLPSEDCNWAHVRFLAKSAGPNKLLDEVSTDDVRKVIREVEKLGRADGTINRYLSHIKVFLDKCHKGKLRMVPVADIEFDFRKESRGRIRWLSFEEEARLLELVPDNIGKLIRVALATGCRRDELITLKPEHIIDNTLYLWDTKNDEPREVPMTDETTALITELVNKGTMPSRRTLRRQWDKAKKKMGLEHDDDFVFHACRHTCATRMLDAGVDVLVIKEWLGHKRIETTQRYTHVKSKNKVDALAMVGEMKARVTQKSQKSAYPTVPHSLPHGGENDKMAIAA